MALSNGFPSNGNGAGHGSHIGRGAASLNDADRAAIEFLRYWSLLWRRRWLIGSLAVIAALTAGLVTRFYCAKWYRAEAVITPLGAGEEADSGLGESPFGAVAGIGSLLGIGAGGDNVVTAERFVTIMESYDFGLGLIERENLAPLLAQPAVFTAVAKGPSPWRLHLLLNQRFASEYDYRTGNLTLYFSDPDRATARQVLAGYIASLRDRLRSEAVRAASTAADSLADEVRKTPDALLQNQLYELMARQIQRQKLAQVQADFAFKIVDPPVVPDHYYTPVARTRAALAGFTVFALLAACLMIREWLRGAALSLTALAVNDDALTPAPAMLGPVKIRARGGAAVARPAGNGHGGSVSAAEGRELAD